MLIYLILIVAIAILLFFLEKLNNVTIENATIDKKTQFNPQQTLQLKHDCDSEIIYSFTDEQCSLICNKNNFISRNGMCVNKLAFTPIIVTNNCDPKRGVLAYLTGNTQFGTANLRCLTVDDGVQPSDLSQPNTLCQNGQININYLTGFPQLSNCKCPQDYTLAIIPNTSAIRTRGVCIKNNQKNAFNSLLYENNNQNIIVY